MKNTSASKIESLASDSDAKRLRVMIDYLYDGVPHTFTILYYIKTNFKEWYRMTEWLYVNQLRGDRLVEFFRNHSEDGIGLLGGCAEILHQIGMNKFTRNRITGDVLK